MKPERLVWTAAAWEDYVWWQGQDRKTQKRINLFTADTLRHPFEGVGKPEPLRENIFFFGHDESIALIGSSTQLPLTTLLSFPAATNMNDGDEQLIGRYVTRN